MVRRFQFGPQEEARFPKFAGKRGFVLFQFSIRPCENLIQLLRDIFRQRVLQRAGENLLHFFARIRIHGRFAELRPLVERVTVEQVPAWNSVTARNLCGWICARGNFRPDQFQQYRPSRSFRGWNPHPGKRARRNARSRYPPRSVRGRGADRLRSRRSR